MSLNTKKRLLKANDRQDLLAEDVSRSNPKLAALSDTEIWHRFRNDDKAAFIHIYTTYFKVLYNYGHKLCMDEELIKDCIHDVFAHINESKGHLSVRNIKFYLLKSFKTRFLYYQKRNSRFVTCDKACHENNFEFTLSAESKIIDAQLNGEKVARLNAAIQQLPSRQREAIYYFFYEELSVDDIKEIMQVGSSRTIQNLIYRGIAVLKTTLGFLVLLAITFFVF